ncbi:MAG: hypothetical protein ACREDZ_05930 [Kiloniellales bacterium]
MAENVFYLHGHPEPIRHYLRLGTSGHRQLEALLASGQMPVESVVAEAAAFERQGDLVTAREQLMRLSKIPESLRARGFLDVDLASAAPTARQAAKLKVADEKLGGLLHRTSERMERMERMQAMLEDLHKTVGNAARSATPRRRGGESSASASRSR